MGRETLESMGIDPGLHPSEYTLHELLLTHQAWVESAQGPEGQLRVQELEEEAFDRLWRLHRDDALETAELELSALIEQTDDPEGGDDHMTPLARAHKRIEDAKENAFHPLAAKGYEGALSIIEQVGEDVKMDTGHHDPLTSANFEALDAIKEVLHGGPDN